MLCNFRLWTCLFLMGLVLNTVQHSFHSAYKPAWPNGQPIIVDVMTTSWILSSMTHVLCFIYLKFSFVSPKQIFSEFCLLDLKENWKHKLTWNLCFRCLWTLQHCTVILLCLAFWCYRLVSMKVKLKGNGTKLFGVGISGYFTVTQSDYSQWWEDMSLFYTMWASKLWPQFLWGWVIKWKYWTICP